MLVVFDTSVKTDEIHFMKSNRNEKRFGSRTVFLDETVMLRSENSLFSLLSRIRKDYNVTNENIHFIGMQGIHYLVIVRHLVDGKNTFREYILPIKKSKDELVLRTLMNMSRGYELSELDDILKKVVLSHSIIKKGIRVFKSVKFYYKLLMAETDQSSLDKFCKFYNIQTKLDIGDYSRFAVVICKRMESVFHDQSIT